MTFVFYIMMSLLSSPSENLVLLPGEPNTTKNLQAEDQGENETNQNNIVLLPGEPNTTKSK